MNKSYQPKEGEPMLINEVSVDFKKAKEKYERESKSLNSKGKREYLIKLKKETLEAFINVIKEIDVLNEGYDRKIKEIEATPYIGYSTTTEMVENVNYAKSRILAEIEINPNKQSEIIDNALSSKVKSQAIIELINSKLLVRSPWTEEVYRKAFVTSKSQKEIDWEIDKQKKIEDIKRDSINKYNYGSYLGAIKILNGDVLAGTPTLERFFDDQIADLPQNE